MIKLTLRGIRANLGRLLLTLLSVVVGVSFVSGSFVLADSLRSLFDQVAEDSFAAIDANIRVIPDDLTANSPELPRFSDELVEQVAGLPEVGAVEPGLFVFEKLYTVDENGEALRPQGPPVFSGSWDNESGLSPFRILGEGTGPVGDQIAIDLTQAESGGFKVGDTVPVAAPAGEILDFELSAIVDFGDGGSAGAYFLLFDLPTAQRLLQAEGEIDSIAVGAAGGVSTPDLMAAIEPLLADELEVVSSETVINEQQDAFGGFIDIFGNVLLGFAIVVLFVSTFIIYNTFAILVGQRTRQLGLLRSIGASGAQIRTIVLFEAVVIGLVASLIGLFGGLGVATFLKGLLNTNGGAFPEGPLEIRTRTIIVVFVVGLLVTVVSALLPAIRASRVSPLEAIQGGGQKERSLTYRVVAGNIVAVPGLGLLGVGMFASFDSISGRLTALGFGAALTFIGVAMLSALFASQTTQLLGKVVLAPGNLLRFLRSSQGPNPRKTVAEIGVLNAARNPQRTTATATALMIGLALISGVAVLTSSLLATLDGLLEDAFSADLFVFEENQGLDFSAAVVDQLDALPEVADAAATIGVPVFLDDTRETIVAFDTDSGTSAVNYGVVEGPVELSDSGISVYQPEAEKRGIGLGDTVKVEFAGGVERTLTVESIFDDNAVVGESFIVDRPMLVDLIGLDTVQFVSVIYADVDGAEARKAVEAVTDNFPQLGTQDNTEIKEQANDQIAGLRAVIFGVLMLCVVVAFIGIINTMTLSILERIREIGLLRAVGMTRRQLRASIRTEAIVVSIFGALLGILTGVLLGVASVVAIPDYVIERVSVPWVELLIYLVVGGMLGLLSAFFPARRAAKLNVLDAISYE